MILCVVQDEMAGCGRPTPSLPLPQLRIPLLVCPQIGAEGAVGKMKMLRM
jgi:hypothetical protein